MSLYSDFYWVNNVSTSNLTFIGGKHQPDHLRSAEQDSAKNGVTGNHIWHDKPCQYDLNYLAQELLLISYVLCACYNYN